MTALAPLALLLAAFAAQAQSDHPSLDPLPAPRLAVMIAVDQMIPEQLNRLQPLFEGGYARLLAEGRVYHAARLRYSRTETGPGHASFGTGCQPKRHGIVANDFRDADRGGWTYCAGDDDARPITRRGLEQDSPFYHVSPRNLLVPGSAAWFARYWPEGKRVTVAGKDRAAILTAGSGGDAVVWWDRYVCGFTTSSHYGDALPAWAVEWNTDWRAAVEGFVWEPLLPLDRLRRAGTGRDDRPGEASLSRNGRTFPHPAPKLSAEPGAAQLQRLGSYVYLSPLADQFTLELARRAVVAEDLGGDEHLDLLVISLSSTDTVGHMTGPYSAETTDVVLRTDRELGTFFALLDERIGKDAWVACFTSDHGVLELPEARRERLDPGGRLEPGALGTAREAVRAALLERFGSHFGAALTGGGLYLSAPALAEAQAVHDAETGGGSNGSADANDVRTFARDFLVREVWWLAAGYTPEELAAAPGPDEDPFLALARNSFRSSRCPDVTLRVVPWTLIDRGTGTTHGTPYAYDRRVPLIFLGAPFEHGESWEPVESIDALPTLLHALGADVPAGAFDGRVLD